MSEADQFDVIVVGAGAAGSIAALVAAQRGANVLLLEKSVLRGTNAQLSGGFLQAAGTRYQQEMGIEDSPELMMADIMKKNGGVANVDVVAEICRRSKDYIHFIADHVGLELHVNTTIKWYGHSAFRMHAGPAEKGSELVAQLRRAVAAEERVTLVDEARVTGLLAEDGRVTGVTAGIGDGTAEELRASGVVLACSGFGNNRQMLTQYCPDALDAVYIGSETSTGEGITWGMALGADVEFMSAWQGHAHVNPKYGTHLSGGLPYLGSIMVNLNGERFAREDLGYSELTPVILAQPSGIAVEIFDQRIVDALWTNGVFREAYDAGAVHRFERLEDLAAAHSLPVETVRRTVAAYNEGTRGTAADAFGREPSGTPLEAPWYGSVVTGGIAHTQGGLRIDPAARVLTPAGQPIAGLFAAGGTAAGMSGLGVAGYTSGNGLSHAFTTGLIAGESASAPVVSST
ncbi:fumarate reductase flavoprotein subunit [Micromonospora profundi]|uniref:FAD-dependent oxidoreductase n=1 Tax=Micromonospora profundi TaxID=1420889 RepID=UPI00143A84CE|nr:FAD-dependent oxidoreductase [Micromonospora profundi]NJC12971.1 fumarate reductase flavoprotein subunit [Micromonospora profundi]